MNTYPLGSAINLFGTFTQTSTGTAVDPTVVKARVRDPANTEVIYADGSITHSSTGHYTVQILPSVIGVWRYRWEGTGAVIAADEKQFEIRPSGFTLDF